MEKVRDDEGVRSGGRGKESEKGREEWKRGMEDRKE